MKIKTWIKYENSYLPTPRCRKLRYNTCEEFIEVTLKEVTRDKLKLAFEDNSYSGVGEIFFYSGKLWCKSKVNASMAKEHGCNTALEQLIWVRENSSTYFFTSWCREVHGKDTSRDAVVKAARNGMKGYLLVDGELYQQIAEPRYVINTFGLGHNHGGTGMFCEYHYNPNISRKAYFSALESDAAVAFANEVATRRGDTKDIGKFKPFIVVHMPEAVKIKPRKKNL